MNARRLAAAAFVVLVGCSSSPEGFDLASKTAQGLTPIPPSRSMSIAEGDVLVIEAKPRDADSSRDPCVNAGSSDPAVLDVKRVQGNCRRFIVMPRAGGATTVTFRVGDLRETVAFSVQPRP